MQPQAAIETELGTERQCVTCREFWPADAEFFYKAPTRSCGLESSCKACSKKRRAQPALPSPYQTGWLQALLANAANATH